MPAKVRSFGGQCLFVYLIHFLFTFPVTEIQNVQIGDGEVSAHQLPIPIYMVFPRLFTCPTLITNNFKIEFEIKIVVILEDNHIITENIPIKLIRHSIEEIKKK